MNNKIEPHYVNFEQAKWLKEKGFNLYCSCSYWKKDFTRHTPGYALENGETSQENYYDFPRYYAPEQWQVIEWLRVNHGIWAEVRRTQFFGETRFQAYVNDTPLTGELGGFVSQEQPKEAYSAAFNYIRENNLI